jgi:hypothetical protein
MHGDSPSERIAKSNAGGHHADKVRSLAWRATQRDVQRRENRVTFKSVLRPKFPVGAQVRLPLLAAYDELITDLGTDRGFMSFGKGPRIAPLPLSPVSW